MIFDNIGWLAFYVLAAAGILGIRFFLLKNKGWIVAYYLLLGLGLMVFCGAGSGVVSDGHERLDAFVQLEEQGKLFYAKAHPQEYKELALDLEQFKNSNEFRSWVQGHDSYTDVVCGIWTGWFLAIVVEFAFLMGRLVLFVWRRVKP